MPSDVLLLPCRAVSFPARPAAPLSARADRGAR